MARGNLNSAGIVRSPALVADTSKPLTLVSWVLLTGSASTTNVIYTVTNSGGDSRQDIQMRTGAVRFYAASAITNTPQRADDGQADMVTGVWYHAASVFASASDRIAYRNGVPGTRNTATLGPLTTFDENILSGIPSGFNFTIGYLAFPAAYNIDLSASDIGSLAAGAHPRMIRPQNLISCLEFTGSIRSTEVDRVSSIPWAVGGSPIDVPNPPIYH